MNADINNLQIMEGIKQDTFEDKAFGCILGGFIGDSCGSFNRLNFEVATEDHMDECMAMPGGGQYEVGAG